MNIAEERILDFLDGRLASPDEEELLHSLAVSPERRQVMREHMNLRQLTTSAARQEQFNVPGHLTNQLFDRLSDMGYSAPAGTNDILTRAPEFVSSRIPESIGAAALGAGTGLSGVWRFGAISLLTASVISFILGAGAYYVFGSAVGLRTHSEEVAALRHAPSHYTAAAQPAAQYDLTTASMPVDVSTNPILQSIISRQRLIAPASPIESLGQPVKNTPADVEQTAQQSTPTIPAITYTAARDPMAGVEMTAPRYLPNVDPVWPEAIPSPFLEDRGTIGVRFGVGPAPDGTSSAVSMLSEFRLGWSLGYFTGGASMGQLNSIERSAQAAPKSKLDYSKGFVITTPENANRVSTTLIGLDAGITLDPLGVPVNAMVGFMYSGGGDTSYSTFYERASLMVHFEPWRQLSIAGGIEGLWYSHDLRQLINDQKAFYSHYHTTVSPSAITNETCGLVGPTLQLGWHF